MKNRVLNFTLIFFGLVLAIAIISFLFWRLGILKKEPEPSQVIEDLKKKIDFINSYPFQTLNDYLKNLSTQVLQFPSISPEEIGRPSLF